MKISQELNHSTLTSLTSRHSKETDSTEGNFFPVKNSTMERILHWRAEVASAMIKSGDKVRLISHLARVGTATCWPGYIGHRLEGWAGNKSMLSYSA